MVGGGEFQGITRLGQMVLASLMEIQMWCPPTHAGWVEEYSIKELLPALLSGKSAPPVFDMKPDNSVHRHVSLGPFLAAALVLVFGWSESVSKSIYRPFEKNAWDSSSPQAHTAKSLLVFTSCPVVGRTPPFSGGSLQLRYSS